MAIEKLCAYGTSKPQPSADVALIRLTNPVDGLQPVEVHHGLDGFHSVTIIRAGGGGDIAAVMHERLSSLDFESQNDLTVSIISDCHTVSAFDAIFIAHIDFPGVPMETQNGDKITGFKTRVRPIVEDDFESGAIAALDGIVADGNPYPYGTEAHDKWMCGYQTQAPMEDNFAAA